MNEETQPREYFKTVIQLEIYTPDRSYRLRSNDALTHDLVHTDIVMQATLEAAFNISAEEMRDAAPKYFQYLQK